MIWICLEYRILAPFPMNRGINFLRQMGRTLAKTEEGKTPTYRQGGWFPLIGLNDGYDSISLLPVR